MRGVHDVFHIFMLRKYLRDLEHHTTLELVTIETFAACPLRILEESK